MTDGREDRAAEPGDLLLHPVVLVALAVLVANDHVLKAWFPGPVTGKLSDVAGMVFFPLLLVAGRELALAAVGRWRAPSVRTLSVAVAASGMLFVLVKTTATGAWAFGGVIGIAQWLLGLPVSFLAGGMATPHLARVVTDPTDLIALPALAIAMAVGRRRAWASSGDVRVAEARAMS